jgi:hypothetical protein
MKMETNIISVDGDKWDISELVISDSFGLRCRSGSSLYPRIVSGSDLSKSYDKMVKKSGDGSVETAVVKLMPPPKGMRLSSNPQGKHVAPYGTDYSVGLNNSNSNGQFDQTRVQGDLASRRSRSKKTCDSDTDSSYHSDDDKLLLEVSPGMEVVLRGSGETRRAIKNWQIICVNCMECCVELHCIEDAEYVLCPLCRCVSPLSVMGKLKDGAHGVGLGFQTCPKPRRQKLSTRGPST